MNKFENAKFPLPSSLFWKDPVGNVIRSTWDLLSQDFLTSGVNDRLITKQIEYGSKLYTFMTYNMVDPSCGVVNPWVGNPTAAQIVARYQAMNPIPLNEPQWEHQWKPILNTGTQPGVYLVPTALCGDDRASTNNLAFLQYYLPAFIIGLYPFASAYNLASEASKTMSVGQMEQAIGIMKNAFVMANLPPKPIAVHLQGTNAPQNADVLMYEFSFHPAQGDNHSVAEIITEARQVLARYPKSIWFQELNLNCESQRAREQARAIRDMAASDPRIVGLPGPC